jgi:isoquinoline 1-oxidoreductase
MPEELEPERYELREPPAYEFDLDRRDFIEIAGVGLLLTFTGRTVLAQRVSGPADLGARLKIGEDGTVTIFTGKVEVGQGSRTELAMAAAEELGLPLEKIRMVMADTDQVPNDGNTAGSRTTPSTVPAVRRAAAAARALLRGRQGEAELTPVRDWRVLGTPHDRLDGREIVTGAHRFPSDIVRPNMLYGSVLRPPSYGATLVEADLAAAAKMPGVTPVRDGAFVGCAAPTSFASRQAVEAIAVTAKWETKEHVSSRDLFAHLKKTGNRPRVQTKGSIEEGLAQASRRLRATYQVPYVQHAPLEPRWPNGTRAA